MQRSSLKAISILLLILIWMSSVQRSSAGTEAVILVNTTVDELNSDGDCSLREAIRAANTDLAVDACTAGSGTDTITIPAGNYTLTIPGRNENLSATGDLDVLASLTISGAGQALSIINGSGLDRVFEIRGTPTVAISGVTVQGGNPGTSFGGPEVYGGGISIFGNATLTLSQATLQNNTAYQGGGFENNGGAASLTGVRISQNSAVYMGGVHNTGTLHLTDCTVIGNSSSNYSGGVHSDFSLILEKSTVSGNTAVTNGGGLYIHGGTAEIKNSTVSGNTISGVQGGGVWIYYQAEVTIRSSTISNNTGGGGVYNYHEGPIGPPLDPNIFFINTLLSGNTVANCARALNTPAFATLGHNLDSGNTCEFYGTGDLVNTPAGIGPLQDNGGPTYTHALLAGSAAINAGDNIGCPATDQRGVSRPQGGTCDIGAYERIPTGEANLSLTKVDALDPVIVGNNITYNLTVSNLGSDSAASTSLTDNLPAGVSFVSATPSVGSCGHSAGVVTCSLGTIANAGSATVQIVATANSIGEKVNNASVSSTTADPNPANNSASASTTVSPAPSQANLSLTKVDVVDPVIVGNNITYNLTVNNLGPDSAVSTILTDTLPAGVSFVSASPGSPTCGHASGVVTCNLGTIANAGSVPVQIIVTANTTGVKVNNASVSSSTADPNTANNSASASTTVNPVSGPQANLSLIKADAVDPVVVGSNITYTLTVSNAGPDTAQAVTLTDNLPTSLVYESATPGQGSCGHTAGVVTCSLGNISNAAQVSVEIVATTTLPGVLNNNASVSSSTADPNPANNSASTGTTVHIRQFLPIVCRN